MPKVIATNTNYQSNEMNTTLSCPTTNDKTKRKPARCRRNKRPLENWIMKSIASQKFSILNSGCYPETAIKMSLIGNMKMSVFPMPTTNLSWGGSGWKSEHHKVSVVRTRSTRCNYCVYVRVRAKCIAFNIHPF